MEIIETFCNMLNLSINDFFEIEVKEDFLPKTYSDLFKLLFLLHDLSNNTYLGLKPNLETNDFFATIKFEYADSQVAAFTSSWKAKYNQFLANEITTEDYDSWKVSTMNMFQYPLGMKKIKG